MASELFSVFLLSSGVYLILSEDFITSIIGTAFVLTGISYLESFYQLYKSHLIQVTSDLF